MYKAICSTAISHAEALVNTVNIVGVMGKGVALQFKEHFPLNFKLYQQACKKGELQIGKMFVTSTNTMMNPKWIINFPTKKHWMNRSSYAYIESGLEDLANQIRTLKIQSIAIPPLGAGQGGLEWGKVKKLIQEKLNGLDIDITTFEPVKQWTGQQTNEKAKLTKPRTMVLSLMRQYRKLGYDITLLEIQKLAYFLQRMGQEDLKLDFQQSHYGPYAHNLQHLLHELEKGYIITEKTILDSKPLDIIYLNKEAENEIDNYIEAHCSEEEMERLDKVSSLMSGYESPFGLELLATVDWIKNADRSAEITPEYLKEKIARWSERKNELFELNHLQAAARRLSEYSAELA